MRNFALIEMETVDEAVNAIRSLNGQKVDGHTIKVNEARLQGYQSRF
jgi:RNA recognition motif-containing protein